MRLWKVRNSFYTNGTDTIFSDFFPKKPKCEPLSKFFKWFSGILFRISELRMDPLWTKGKNLQLLFNLSEGDLAYLTLDLIMEILKFQDVKGYQSKFNLAFSFF